MKKISKLVDTFEADSTPFSKPYKQGPKKMTKHFANLFSKLKMTRIELKNGLDELDKTLEFLLSQDVAVGIGRLDKLDE